MMSIKELGVQLVQIKNRWFAQKISPEEDAAHADGQPNNEEANYNKNQNLEYGKDPNSIMRYSRRFIKLDAVFEQKSEPADSWAAKSIEPNASKEQSLRENQLEPEDADELIREAKHNVSMSDKADSNRQVSKKSGKIGSYVMGPKNSIKFASD